MLISEVVWESVLSFVDFLYHFANQSKLAKSLFDTIILQNIKPTSSK